MPDEKVFTQDELNEQIKARLARQQKQFDEEQEKIKAELVSLKAEQKAAKEAAEAAARAEIESLKIMVDPAVLELFPETLPLDEQVTWLKKASGQLPKQDKTLSPKTPAAKKGEKEFTPYPVKRKLV